VPLLLRTYWNISQRQTETSVVLAAPPMTREDVGKIIVPYR